LCRKVEKTPLPFVRKTSEAMDNALAADAGQLVDARNVGAADDEIDARGARLQRGAGIIHCRRARADHCNATACELCEIDVVRRMRPEPAIEPRCDLRNEGTA